MLLAHRDPQRIRETEAVVKNSDSWTKKRVALRPPLY